MPKKKGPADYDVGYKKPPKHSRFKKGQSGNPKGRPKDRPKDHTSIPSMLQEMLKQKVTITEGGKQRKVDYTEAFVKQLMAKGLNGSTRDQIQLLKALKDYAPDLLKMHDWSSNVTVTYVLPDGKTMEDYENPEGGFDTLHHSVKASSAGKGKSPDPEDKEDDSWLD